MKQKIKNQQSVTDFANKEFINFSRYDCERSIANVIDGQKITMRKILFTMMNGRETLPEVKVAQLASYTAAETDYHHGEQGIGGVISNMAQNFVGSNNMNLMEPIGQFGSRLNPEPGAARYIHTRLSGNFRQLFKKEDDVIIEHQYSDDMKIEPAFYLPILPVLLINGSEGIGTGFASKVFSHNPAALRDDILSILKGKKRKPLTPWYKGFTGAVLQGDNPLQWITKGKIEVVNTTTLKITELPIGMYQDDIKSVLVSLIERGLVKDFEDDSTGSTGILITVTVPRSTACVENDKLIELFKLISKGTQNLTAWLANGKLKTFNNASEIVDYFTEFRLQKFEDRRQAWIQIHSDDLAWMNEKIKFIRYYLKNSETLSKKKKVDLHEILDKAGFKNIDKLLEIKIYNMTLEQIEKLEQEIKDLKGKIDFLKNTTAKEMYILELEGLKV